MCCVMASSPAALYTSSSPTTGRWRHLGAFPTSLASLMPLTCSQQARHGIRSCRDSLSSGEETRRGTKPSAEMLRPPHLGHDIVCEDEVDATACLQGFQRFLAVPCCCHCSRCPSTGFASSPHDTRASTASAYLCILSASAAAAPPRVSSHRRPREAHGIPCPPHRPPPCPWLLLPSQKR